MFSLLIRSTGSSLGLVRVADDSCEKGTWSVFIVSATRVASLRTKISPDHTEDFATEDEVFHSNTAIEQVLRKNNRRITLSVLSSLM